MVHVELQNLNQEAVNEMLADVLHLDDVGTEEMAAVVHTKKHSAIPFFVIQYLRNLYQTGTLRFSMGLTKRIWNMSDIEAHTDATTNVVHLMQTRLQTLPRELHQFLPLAACLGSSFQSTVLSVLFEAVQLEKCCFLVEKTMLEKR